MDTLLAYEKEAVLVCVHGKVHVMSVWREKGEGCEEGEGAHTSSHGLLL